MVVVHRTPRARHDLLDIWDHAADYSMVHADALLDTLEEKIWWLAENPLLGREREELNPGLRSYLVEGYLIFYVPQERGIEIVRVLSARSDYQRQFEQE